MSISELELINGMLPIMATSFGFFVAFVFGRSFLSEWRESRLRDYEMRREELSLRSEEIKKSKNNNNIVVNNETSSSDTDLGGYVTINIPEDRKSVFQDLLKGFEEYAQIKGYKVSVSVDSSTAGKISFKISINDFGVTGTRASVKNDLDEYINKIKTGEPLDDMPEVINSVEHFRLVMALKNRVSFLQQNYEVEKNIREFYQGFFEKLPISGFSHSNPIFHISNGGQTEMDQRKYIAKNSANVMQGDNQNNLISAGTVIIGSTYAEKSAQIDNLNALIEFLENNSSINESKNAKRQFENIKEELTEEQNPDKGLIEKWLEKAKSLVGIAEKGSELFSKAKSVYDSSFGIEF